MTKWMGSSLAALMLSSVFSASGWGAERQSAGGVVFEELKELSTLREAFNRDKGNIRLVTLLSPSCGYCVKGYRYVRKILEEVSDPRLRVYVVWEPMLSGDSRALAEKMSQKTQDARVVHQSWDEAQLSGKAWQELMGLGGVAWDVYFLYGPEAEWGESGPAMPDYWEHQGAGTRENWLSYETLKAKVEETLSR